MIRRFFFCGLIVFLLGAALPAAVFAQGESLTLEKARELALLNSESLARYNLSVQSSLQAENTQWHSNMPDFSLGASASTDLWTAGGFSDDPLEGLSIDANLGVSYRLPLWDGGKNAILGAINSLNTEMSRLDALSEYYRVLSSVDSAYYGVLEAAAALAAAESSLETSALNLSIAEIRRQSGIISEASYLQALSEKAGKETSRNQSRRNLSVAKLELGQLLGLDRLPALEDFDFTSLEELIRLLSNFDEEKIDPLFAAIWNQVQSKNPSLVRAALSRERAERNLSLAGRDYSPVLDASLSAGVNYNYESGFGPSGGRLSLSATIPLDFWVTAANVESRRLSREQAMLDYSSTLSSVELELYRDILDLISQAGQIVTSTMALDYAQKNFDYTLELYRLSGNSPGELSDAETLLRNARNQLINSRYAFLTGLSNLRNIGVFESDDAVVSLVLSVCG